MAKPSGSVCNINCSYCFYLEKEHLYPERKSRWKMNGDTLENYVRKNIQGQQAHVVDFLWQGGEPTLLGIDFFREAIRLQQQYRGHKQINNLFQTNGFNIDNDWARFLKENQFLVGLSIDGDRVSNDAHRLTRTGKSTFDAVMQGVAALRRHKVEFNTLTVVNAENVKRPLDVYRFLKGIGSRHMQFIPLVERRATQPDENGLVFIQPTFSRDCSVTEWSVPAKAYGRFLNAIFDSWIQHDIGNVFVMNFEQTLTKMTGQPSACVINETCGGNLIVESNGDIYSCDHFVYPEHKLGNINQDALVSMVNSPQNIKFGQDKLDNISKDCLGCEVRPVCNGGCPKHRFEFSSDGRRNRNYFCDGYKTHLTHAMPRMQLLLSQMIRREPLKKVKKRIKEAFY
ncbi:anaerobic sulfatase maturase [Methylobacillus gramineus]|uniref:anaerobic sulfatase maturase n=1 Tax=Methylobacillus gramineus TaxID=755169 RepID=UPI001CFF6467|nr:anaerobic sulfatase maturase [Methylobacillus gramineus]MCB5186090.1 anaerobic sulfatase maturase [Methylobacillus gramineus]